MVTNEELSVVTPADWMPGPQQSSWTYDDYAAFPNDGHHYEIVNGGSGVAEQGVPLARYLTRTADVAFEGSAGLIRACCAVFRVSVTKKQQVGKWKGHIHASYFR